VKYRPLGRTGLDVSVLGFGCMRLPTAGAPDKIDEGKATRLLHEAIEHGVNYIDTAWFYHATSFGQQGQSEPFVGRALSGGMRDRVILATKLPQQIIREPADMERYLNMQLERLNTDHIDCYLVHGLDGENWDRMRDLSVREFLQSAKSSGRIRFAGFSFHGHKDDFPRIINDYQDWSFAQIQFNYMDTEYQAGLAGLKYAATKGLGVVVMEPLKGGRLAHDLPSSMKTVFDDRPEGWSPAEWALRFVWNQPGVSLLLSGMNEVSQLEENLRVAESAEVNGLSTDRLAVFDLACEALRAKTRADCTGCRYCQPCPFGVEIPELMAALNASAIWETHDAWLSGYVLIKGKPGNCTECGNCETICPQHLPIRQLLKETASVFMS